MQNRFRTFIAVSLPSSVLTGIGKLMRELRPHFGDEVRWVETKNLHITLKFLGDVSLNDLPKLIRAVTQSAEQTYSFDLTFQGLGAFPSQESPRTLWIGCREGSEELSQFADTMNDALLPLGFPKESRRFSPHLTIGRIKKPAQEVSLKPIFEEHQNRLLGSCSVSEVQIVASELTRRGPIYDELAAISLR